MYVVVIFCAGTKQLSDIHEAFRNLYPKLCHVRSQDPPHLRHFNKYIFIFISLFSISLFYIVFIQTLYFKLKGQINQGRVRFNKHNIIECVWIKVPERLVWSVYVLNITFTTMTWIKPCDCSAKYTPHVFPLVSSRWPQSIYICSGLSWFLSFFCKHSTNGWYLQKSSWGCFRTDSNETEKTEWCLNDISGSHLSLFSHLLSHYYNYERSLWLFLIKVQSFDTTTAFC